MNNRIYGTVSIAALLVANMAWAGSPVPFVVVEPPVVIPVIIASDFDGFYLGAAVTSTSGSGVETALDDGEVVGLTDFELSGIGGEIHAGYNFAPAAVGFFYGGEVSYGMPNAVITTDAGETGSLDTLLTLHGRAGYVSGPLMYYGLAGYAAGTVNCDTCDPTVFNGSLSGYVLGAGVEYMISSSLSVRGQYEYFDLDEGVDLPIGTDSNTELTATVLSVGLNYHF